jgi:hypothetical protein
MGLGHGSLQHLDLVDAAFPRRRGDRHGGEVGVSEAISQKSEKPNSSRQAVKQT